jgi:hypothetical protein
VTVAPVDWPLVLKFTEALAEPVAIVIAVVVASKYGTQAYARQKLLDRRTAWSEALSKRLADLGHIYRLASVDPSMLPEARDAFRAALHEVRLGIQYVTPAWRNELNAWIDAADGLISMGTPSLGAIEDLQQRAADLISVVFSESRDAYGVPHPFSWRERFRQRMDRSLRKTRQHEEGESA